MVKNEKGKLLVYQTNNLIQLHLVELYLESKGVECDVYEMVSPRPKGLPRGSKIFVEEKDLEAARQYLKECFPPKNTTDIKLSRGLAVAIVAGLIGLFALIVFFVNR